MLAYTDGSAKDGKAGYSVVLVNEQDDIVHEEFGPLARGTTIQQAELWAVIRAAGYQPDIIYCDNNVLVNTHNVWAVEWLHRALSTHRVAVFPGDTLLDMYRLLKPYGIKDLLKSDGRPVANLHLWSTLWDLLIDIGGNIELQWVPARLFDFNIRADELARQGRNT